MRLLTYLACPYTHKDRAVLEGRVAKANEATAWLIKNCGWNVFSPITHSHPLHLAGLRGDWEFWKRIDEEYLTLSKRIVILTLPGWRESVGVTAEIKIARDQGIEIYFLTWTPDGTFALTLEPDYE
jgi:hypothetical protein